MRHYFCILEIKYGFKFFELREMLRLLNKLVPSIYESSVDISKLDLKSSVTFLNEFEYGYNENC